MLAHFPSTNRYLTRLDLGHVSGVPILEALPSQAWHIPPHFMKNSNDPLAQVWGAFVRHALAALIGISLHLSALVSALVCTYRH